FSVNLEDDILHTVVPRKFISNTYGGSTQTTLPTIGGDHEMRDRFNNFMCLTKDFQPCAPLMPGRVGIWLNGSNNDIHRRGTMRVISRVTKNPSRWVYQGQYRLYLSKPLTKDEWTMQSVAVRNTWAKALSTKPWGCYIRKGIYAQKLLSRKPTNGEVGSITPEQDMTITAEEVALALTRGDESITVFLMKCIGYDEGFQRDI
ncbi:hypothetical protein FA15DRAFT_549690, partial [Coprinopsis marcescibilis]